MGALLSLNEETLKRAPTMVFLQTCKVLCPKALFARLQYMLDL